MTGKPKVLIVEDETAVAMMMTYLLTHAGCEVRVAHTAEQGMQLARTRGFDLITLDIVLPGTSGFEICRRLKQIPRLHDTPVVFVSGHTSEKNQQRAFVLGAVDYIEKPFDAQDFVSRILSHIKTERDPDLVEALTESSMA
jgi:DNA-binding response OmpR family regulator